MKKNIRLWLDDVRPMPDDFDVWCKDETSAIQLVQLGVVKHISFDHDLGTGNGSGYGLACVIESGAYHNTIPSMTWDIHSQNPVGRDNIAKAMMSADNFWSMNFFINVHCTGKQYDSCIESPCIYSSSTGCRHPKHPKYTKKD